MAVRLGCSAVKYLGTLIAPAALLAGFASAQSLETLEAIRIHRPNAVTLATSDLEHCATARCPDLPRLSLLVGFLKLSGGDAHTARLQLESAPAPAGLEPYHAFYLGEAQFYDHDPASAAQSFSQALAGAPPALLARTRARLGEAFWSAGKPKEAAPYLEHAIADLDAPELFWARSQVRAALGSPSGEREDFHTLAVRFPAHPYGREALARLDATAADPLSFDERLQRARELIDGNAPLALDELDTIQNHKLARRPPQRARVSLVRAYALYALGRPDDAEKEIAVALKGPQDVAGEAAMLRAKRSLRQDDNPRSRALMVEIEKRFAKGHWGDEAGFFVGWLDFQAGRYEQAVSSLELFDKRHHHSHKRDEALWFRALSLLRLKRYALAEKTLQLLIKEVPLSPAIPQALYWSTRAHELANEDPRPAVAVYQQIIQQFPNSFYEWLSELRLHALSANPPLAFPTAPVRSAVAVPDRLKLAVALSQAGLFRDAAEIEQREIRTIRRPELAMQWGHALQTLGDYGFAYTLASRELWGQGFTEKKGEALALFYPQAFSSAVSAASQGEGVDSSLIWAIMRRESSFRADVRSGANARGLMQLEPNTAVQIAKALSLPAPDPDELFSPEMNIKLGTWYLSQLGKRFSHVALVAAAYNAGPTAVGKWLRERGDLPLDLFVEMIPYRETRAYVKQVVADFHAYHLLYDRQGVPPPLEMSLPDQADGGVEF